MIFTSSPLVYFFCWLTWSCLWCGTRDTQMWSREETQLLWKPCPPYPSDSSPPPAVSTSKLANTDLLPSSPGPGGTHCQGASVEHAACENLPCPKGVPSFRDQQCQAHDRLSSKKRGLLTAVVVDGKSPSFQCSLHLPPSPPRTV